MALKLVIGVLASGLLAATSQSRPTSDDWNAWSAFPEGAWVKLERNFRDAFKSTQTFTLIKKSADKVTVKLEVEKKKDEGDDQPTVTLNGVPFANNNEYIYEKNPKPILCPTCRANHKPSLVTERKKEKLKVGDKEVLCYVMDVVPFDCDGTKSGTSRWWLSKEVPGGLVKREWTAKDRPGLVVDTILDFDKKKKVESGDQDK
jgi:hypothetical protein